MMHFPMKWAGPNGALAAVAMLVAALPADASESTARATLLDRRAVSMSMLYAESPATVAEYATALARYRAAREQGVRTDAAPLISSSEGSYFVPWLWATEDGATIRKLKTGAFVVTSGQLLGNWYADTQCYSAGWPSYMCTDDQERLMSAPNATTIIFGDIEYTRSVPGIGADPARPADPSVMSDQTFGPLPKKLPAPEAPALPKP